MFNFSSFPNEKSHYLLSCFPSPCFWVCILAQTWLVSVSLTISTLRTLEAFTKKISRYLPSENADIIRPQVTPYQLVKYLSFWFMVLVYYNLSGPLDGVLLWKLITVINIGVEVETWRSSSENNLPADLGHQMTSTSNLQLMRERSLLAKGGEIFDLGIR